MCCSLHNLLVSVFHLKFGYADTCDWSNEYLHQSDLFKLVPDIVVEDLLTEGSKGGNGGDDAGVELAVRANLLYHINVVAVRVFISIVLAVCKTVRHTTAVRNVVRSLQGAHRVEVQGAE